MQKKLHWIILTSCELGSYYRVQHIWAVGYFETTARTIMTKCKNKFRQFLGSYFPIFGLTKLYHIRIWVTWVQWSPKPQDGPSHPNN
jgi:hypothetical protein